GIRYWSVTGVQPCALTILLCNELRDVVVDPLERARRDLAVGILDEGGRRVDDARGDACGFDRCQQCVLTLDVAVDRLKGSPGRKSGRASCREQWRSAAVGG